MPKSKQLKLSLNILKISLSIENDDSSEKSQISTFGNTSTTKKLKSFDEKLLFYT